MLPGLLPVYPGATSQVTGISRCSPGCWHIFFVLSDSYPEQWGAPEGHSIRPGNCGIWQPCDSRPAISKYLSGSLWDQSIVLIHCLAAAFSDCSDQLLWARFQALLAVNPYVTGCISKIYNGLEVITEQLSNSERPDRSCQLLPDAPRKAECKAMYCQVLRDYVTCALVFSGSCGTEYKNILKSVQLSSKCYKMKLLRCANFGAIGSVGHIHKGVLVHLEPGSILSLSE